MRRRSMKMFDSGIFSKVIVILLVGLLAWGYKVIQPVQPKICGSPGGPPITAPRIKLRDGRYLAYKEHGVPKDTAKFKLIYVHGFRYSRLSIVDILPLEVANELNVYALSFDMPGYGESDPDPERTLKSVAWDIEELADKIELGSKFYLVGFSMGGGFSWGCIKYIPHRLAGVCLLTPLTNYWWQGFPANVSTPAFLKQSPSDQWALRVAHFTPWLTYWWNTQTIFPRSKVIAADPCVFSSRDKEIVSKMLSEKKDEVVAHREYALQQGEYESIHRDLVIGFGKWEFDPLELEKPFANKDVSVHVWQGDEDLMVPVELQRYIAQKLPWIHYHELAGAGHFFIYSDGLPYQILKTMLSHEI